MEGGVNLSIIASVRGVRARRIFQNRRELSVITERNDRLRHGSSVVPATVVVGLHVVSALDVT